MAVKIQQNNDIGALKVLLKLLETQTGLWAKFCQDKTLDKISKGVKDDQIKF